MTTEPATERVHIRRLRLHNYRSVRECDVALQSGLTFLVGPNGAGKSNVLDGLRLVSDALNSSLGQAMSDRGGLTELLHRGVSRASDLTIEIDFETPQATGNYLIRLGPADIGLGVVAERCTVRDAAGAEHFFTVSGGVVMSSEPTLPLPDEARLYLVTAANLPVFTPVFDALSTMRFYNLQPATMREYRTTNPESMLARDGGNIAAVLHQMADQTPAVKTVVENYLAAVVPGIAGVDALELRPRLETLEFRQAAADGPARFSPAAISDGTLHALGVLVAIFQPGRRALSSLVGVEEPEAGLHPVASAAVYDALRFASERRQVVVISHSPDLLDNDEVEVRELLAVTSRGGETFVGPIDPLNRAALEERLFTPGELVRHNQLVPDDLPPPAPHG